MDRISTFRKFLLACVVLACATGAQAEQREVSWWDPVGDAGPVGDAISVRLAFDSLTGAWTAFWEASALNPFTGNARFNLNLFDTATGDPGAASAPQVSLDGFKDFGAGTATSYSYSGTASVLTHWQPGHLIVTSNDHSFQSGAVSMNSPYGRDLLVAGGEITTAVPETESYAMMIAGLGMLGLLLRRRRRTLGIVGYR